MKKYLLICRHSDKTPDGKHISGAGYQLIFSRLPRMIATNVLETINQSSLEISDFFHGIEVRTCETMAAAVCATQKFKATVHGEPIEQLGDDVFFGTLMARGFADQVKATGTNLKAAEAVLGDSFAGECQRCHNGVQRMFHEMVGKFGLGFFHSPTVEMAPPCLFGLKCQLISNSSLWMAFCLSKTNQVTFLFWALFAPNNYAASASNPLRL